MVDVMSEPAGDGEAVGLGDPLLGLDCRDGVLNAESLGQVGELSGLGDVPEGRRGLLPSSR